MKNVSTFYLLATAVFAQDWANLSRFENENKLLSEAGNSGNRVVFMGNSITEGWIRTDPEFFSINNFVNRGISGQTTPQMLLRFRQDVINLNPVAVVILAGTNDLAGNTGTTSLETIEGNITSMCELAKMNNIQVVLCSILPAYDYPWKWGVYPTEKIMTINKWMREYAAKNSFVFLDFFTPLADERNGLSIKYSEDGVHPNQLGYSVMKPLVEEAIAKCFQNK